MHQHYRCLTESFRAHMEPVGWPPDKFTLPYLRTRGVRLRSQAYNDLKHGKPVNVTTVTAWLAMLIDGPVEIDRYREALLDYLRPRGFASLTQLPSDAILSQICGPIVAVETLSIMDHLRRGLAGFLARAHSDAHIDDSLMLPGSPGAPTLDDAIRSTYVCVGRARNALGRLLPEEDAIRIATEAMQVSLADYQAKVAAWRCFNPWTCVFARTEDECVGATIVLPVNDAAYDDVLNGRRASSDLSGPDFVVPAPNLLLESCADFTASAGVARPASTEALLACLGLQTAGLARLSERKYRTPIRALSFAGTRANRERLLGSGYVSTGRNMAKTGAEILERELNVDNPSLKQVQDVAMLLLLERVCARVEHRYPALRPPSDRETR